MLCRREESKLHDGWIAEARAHSLQPLYKVTRQILTNPLPSHHSKTQIESCLDGCVVVWLFEGRLP